MAELKDILEQIDNKVNLLQSLFPLKPADQQRLDKKLRLEFNYNSNHLEGNTLTYGETELLLFFDKTNGGHELREYEEMKAHDIALKMIKEEAADTERPLTEIFIRSLNECLLVRPFWKEAITPDGQATQKQVIPGQYKTSPNSVRLKNGEIFNYASPEETPVKMQELAAWYNEINRKESPLMIAALLHYNFVRIHPFDDGNGRVGRLLMNYVLLKNNLPLVVIKSDKKKDYLTALNYADVGETDVFVSYIGEQLLWSLDLTVKAAKGEDIEETGDWQKEIELIKRKVADKSNTTKSPKLVYEIFVKCDTEVSPIIKTTLDNFSQLFNEEKNFHYVNGKDEISSSSSNPMDYRSVLAAVDNIISNKKSIFGYDVYKQDITSITWAQKKYGLRGAEKLTNYEISFSVNFSHNLFTLNIFLNNKNIHSLNKPYMDFILADELNEMNNKLKTHVLEQIKKDTNN